MQYNQGFFWMKVKISLKGREFNWFSLGPGAATGFHPGGARFLGGQDF